MWGGVGEGPLIAPPRLTVKRAVQTAMPLGRRRHHPLLCAVFKG
ncbi:hypothetical protein SAMCCGM7_Ch3351 [Sinorhizobium americanum CCGM7]|nr:hypothetical protein SAMCCGM7_Ch3351 [Sinorhizobium americanum CCGM7]